MLKTEYDEWTEYLQGNDAADGRMRYFYGIAGGAMIALPVAHKLINWIPLKE